MESLCNLECLGAVDVIEEMPIISASFNIFQSGSEISSIKAFEL